MQRVDGVRFSTCRWMWGMHGAGASLDYYDRERIAPSYAQQGGS
jgi:hypothetical protein